MSARITRWTLALVFAAPLACFALPNVAFAESRESPIRKGVYHAVWHTDRATIIITKVHQSGAFEGELRFDPKGRWGDFRTGIHGRLNRDDSISITRDDCNGQQGARAGRPFYRDGVLVWKGMVKGPDFTSNFELYIPAR
jgi:hypothetical protein